MQEINLELPPTLEKLTPEILISAYKELRVRKNKAKPEEWVDYYLLVAFIADHPELNLATKINNWFFVGNWDEGSTVKYKLNFNIYVKKESVKALAVVLGSLEGVKWKFKFGVSSPEKCDSINLYTDRSLSTEELSKISEAVAGFARENEFLTDKKVSDHLYIAAIHSLSQAGAEYFVELLIEELGEPNLLASLVRTYLFYGGNDGLSEGEYLVLLAAVAKYSKVNIEEIHNKVVKFLGLTG